MQRTLSGKIRPRTGAVPSKFAWKRSSPRKRKPPTPRFTAETVTKKKASEASKALDFSTECSEIISEDATSTNVADFAFPETAEIQNIARESECCTDFVEKSEKDLLITELKDKLAAALANNEQEKVVSTHKEKVVDFERKYEKLEERLFSFKYITSNDSLVSFYTGFPNYQTIMALYDFLDPGEQGENIDYWLSKKDGDSTPKSVKQGRPRSLKPVDEFFLTFCRLRQGFAELHLAQLFDISQPTVSRIFIS